MLAEIAQEYKRVKHNMDEKKISLEDILASMPQIPKCWQIDALVDTLYQVEEHRKNNVTESQVNLIITAAYGVGKTTFLAMMVLSHLYMFGALDEDRFYKGNLVAGSEIQLRTVTVHTIKKLLYSSMFNRYFYTTHHGLYIRNNPLKSVAFRVFNETNPDAFSGMHEANGYMVNYFDEGSAIPEEAYDRAENFMDKGNCMWIIAGNPTTTKGPFYSYANKHYFKRLKCSRYDFYGPHDPWSHQIRNEYGEDSDVYRVKVLGEFPLHGSNAVFSLYALNESMTRGKIIAFSGFKKHKCGPVAIGVDVSRGEGACDHSICVRDRLARRLLVTSQLPLSDLPQLIVDIALQFDTRQIAIDAIGCGAGVDQYVNIILSKYRGIRAPIKVVSIISSKSPSYNENCFNKRSELIAETRRWIETGGALCPSEHDERFINEMRQVTIDDKCSKFKVSPKTGINDCADSFFYTFEDPMLLERAKPIEQKSAWDNVL